MNLEAFTLQYLPLIDKRLEELLTFPSSPEAILYEASSYALFSGGKRLRPLLLLATVATLKGDIAKALDLAAALEMVHTYSLIHDDLPSMDDDDFRRGKLTVHKKFDEGTAILAGDFLLTYSFEVLANTKCINCLEIIHVFANRAGGTGMIGGQVLDLLATNQEISLEQLKNIHEKKTGELLTLAIEMGALASNASSSQIQALSSFGHKIGLGFQIMDDVIDVTASEYKHGKKVSSDVLNGKTTYVQCLGLDGARKVANQCLDEALLALSSIPNSSLLESFANKLIHRDL